MKLVRVEIEKKTKTGLFVSTSPDMKGFFDAGYSVNELEARAPVIIRDLHSAAGEHVTVKRQDGDELIFVVD